LHEKEAFRGRNVKERVGRGIPFSRAVQYVREFRHIVRVVGTDVDAVRR